MDRGGMRIVWTVPIATMIAAVEAYRQSIDPRVSGALDPIATDMQDDAQANHPWQNRTGAAEQSLAGTNVQEGHMHYLTLAHGVYYGIYLERMQAGRFSIIMPTMTTYYARIMDDVRRALGL